MGLGNLLRSDGMAIGVPMAYLRRIHGVPVAYHGEPMAYLWRIHGVPMAYFYAFMAHFWRIHGVPLKRVTVMINLGPNVMLRRTEHFIK